MRGYYNQVSPVGGYGYVETAHGRRHRSHRHREQRRLKKMGALQGTFAKTI
jgi:hypothetical protein